MASSLMWGSSLYVADVGHPGAHVIGAWGSEPCDSTVDMGWCDGGVVRVPGACVCWEIHWLKSS